MEHSAGARRGGLRRYADWAGEDSRIAGAIFQRSLAAPHAVLRAGTSEPLPVARASIVFVG
jgi:hypothetical protein